MPLVGHRSFSDAILNEATLSIGASPVAALAIAPCAGILHKVSAAAGGTTTGTITVAVTVSGNASTDVAGGALTIAAGTGTRSATLVDIPKIGSSAVYVNEGDVITFTPSGGGGASIPGAFVAIIREQ